MPQEVDCLLEGGRPRCRLGWGRAAAPRCGRLWAAVAERLLTFADFPNAPSGWVEKFLSKPSRLRRASAGLMTTGEGCLDAWLRQAVVRITGSRAVALWTVDMAGCRRCLPRTALSVGSDGGLCCVTTSRFFVCWWYSGFTPMTCMYAPSVGELAGSGPRTVRILMG